MELLDLAEKWEHSAKNRFLAAEQEKDEFGKRFIEHGALCYFNCAQELRGFLTSSLLQLSAIQKEHWGQFRGQANSGDSILNSSSP